MDIDSYIVEHGPQWDRLQELASRRRLTGAEADELVDLFQRVGTHLSVVRASAYDPVLEARLTSVLAAARSAINGSTVSLLSGLGTFFGATFPAAVYRMRWLAVAVAVAGLGVAALLAYRVVFEPGLAAGVLSPAEQQALVEHQFADYYSENPASDFAFQVWLNNVRVTATAICLGVLIVPLLIVVYSNVSNLGIIAGYMLLHDRADVFFGLILPHGLLELTAVFIGSAAGLRLAWAWISPGLRTRSRALAEEGRTAAAVAVGLAAVLLVSGALEGFLTPSPLPPLARVAIGAAVWLAFCAYVDVLGRRAVRAGHTGDIAAGDRSATEPTEAAR